MENQEIHTTKYTPPVPQGHIRHNGTAYNIELGPRDLYCELQKSAPDGEGIKGYEFLSTKGRQHAMKEKYEILHLIAVRDTRLGPDVYIKNLKQIVELKNKVSYIQGFYSITISDIAGLEALLKGIANAKVELMSFEELTTVNFTPIVNGSY